MTPDFSNNSRDYDSNVNSKHSQQRAFRGWALLALGLSTFFAASPAAYAQSEDKAETTSSSPYAEIQYGTLSGTTNSINVTMLPVVLSNGTTIYKNLTIPITLTETTVNNAINVTFTVGAITAVPFPIGSANGLKAGNYVGPNGELLMLIGPGVTTNGATEWSLIGTAGATACTYPTTATIYDGPLTSNPLYARLKNAGITSTAYSYGVMGSQTCATAGGDWWNNGNIIGVSQTANALTIVSFTFGNDQSTAGSEITYKSK
jgi:hypothetical protein